MKILYICGNMTHYDLGLKTVIKRTRDIFAELGVEAEVVDLGIIHPPYYDGETTTLVDNLAEKIKAADGLVLTCTAQLFAPTAIMQSFLEYLQQPEYAVLLKEKHCMLITLSSVGGEKSALDYLTRVIWHLEGYVAVQLGLQTDHLVNLSADESTAAGEFIDKLTEDFYRAVHQNRKYIVPMDVVLQNNAAPATPVQNIPHSATEMVAQAAPKSPLPAINAFTAEQEEDIDEISRLFTQKYAEPEVAAPPVPQQEPQAGISWTLPEPAPKPSPEPVPTPPPAFTRERPSPPPDPGRQVLLGHASAMNEILSENQEPSAPRKSTAKQITQNLPRYFQPQLSAGLQAVMQINISGDETFQGFLYIHSTECTYTEGTAPAPDIIIISDTSTWLDVINGKHTAQKAFMIGGIKVRGDFVLLTKFDTLFKMPGA